jgi:hypothetical protein
MTDNIVHKNLHKFAIQSISLSDAKDYIENSTSRRPVLIFWETLDDGKTAREMFWGRYKGGKASETREKEGMIALVSKDNSNEYRTVIWDTIWKLRAYDEDRRQYITYYVN